MLSSAVELWAMKPQLDLIVVSTPNATHVPLARAALESGAHVVVDKPFAPTADEARAIGALADRVSRLAIPYQNRRWDGDFLTVQRLLRENKLGDVIEIQDFRDGDYVDRELVMLRVNADSANRSEVMQICDIFRAKIVDVQPKRLAIEITGNESKISKFLKLMENFGISDLTRTGKVAMARVE